MVNEAAERMKSSRPRTNILRNPEFAAIEFLCKLMPNWISSDMLSAIGFLGSIIAAASVYFACYDTRFLFLVVPGMTLQWFGDSLDGRLAYFRNTPRKWYGWLLDMNLDYLTTILLAVAYWYYLSERPVVALLFMAFYGQTMLLAVMRYKLTDVYLIDADGLLGPTELRIVLTLATVLEFFIPGFLFWFAVVAIGVLCVVNGIEFTRLLKIANEKDAKDRAAKNGN